MVLSFSFKCISFESFYVNTTSRKKSKPSKTLFVITCVYEASRIYLHIIALDYKLYQQNWRTQELPFLYLSPLSSLVASCTACPIPPLNQRKQDQNSIVNKWDELRKGDKGHPYNSAKQNSPPQNSGQIREGRSGSGRSSFRPSAAARCRQPRRVTAPAAGRGVQRRGVRWRGV